MHGSHAGTERAQIAPSPARALVRARCAIYEKMLNFPNDFSLDGGGRSRIRTRLSLQIPEMQGDLGEMQGGVRRHPAKSSQISKAWVRLSLLEEQGGYP